MGNSFFQFKEFKIDQDRCAMKVGTDGVLLGAWTRSDGEERILDVGTGTGLIALMLAQSNPLSTIIALEIDSDSAEQASENVANSKFKDRIKVINTSLQTFEDESEYDLVVCNPPFFQQSTMSPDFRRSLARHEASLSIADLMHHAFRLLNAEGRLVIILPIARHAEILEHAQLTGFHLRRTCKVIPNPHKRSKRLMLVLSREAGPHIQEELRIENEEHHDYTPEFIELTAPYYPEKEKDGKTHP